MSNTTPELRTVEVTRYCTPLREGGSLPAIVEGDDGFLYVLKLRGAGQGVKALIAELLAGEIARTIGLKVPELVFARLDPVLSKTEPDEEIQDLLRASGGLNLGLHYLSGAITFDALVNQVNGRLASQIVWLDALVTNVDRTARNTNLLMWHKELWVIDHGAAFYFHHAWQNVAQQGERPFPAIKDHVLLPKATELTEVNSEAKQLLTRERLSAIVALIPDEWLTEEPEIESPEAHRQVYLHFLETRLAASDKFVKEAQDAREKLV